MSGRHPKSLRVDVILGTLKVAYHGDKPSADEVQMVAEDKTACGLFFCCIEGQLRGCTVLILVLLAGLDQMDWPVPSCRNR